MSKQKFNRYWSENSRMDNISRKEIDKLELPTLGRPRKLTRKSGTERTRAYRQRMRKKRLANNNINTDKYTQINHKDQGPTEPISCVPLNAKPPWNSPLLISEEAVTNEKNSPEYEYLVITRKQATNLVNTWVHQVMQLNPGQQSHTIDLINNILLQGMSSTSFPAESSDIPESETWETQTNLFQEFTVPQQSHDRNEYVSNSEWPVKIEPTEDLGDEFVPDQTGNLALHIDIDPTAISQSQPQMKIESNNGFCEGTSSTTHPSFSSDMSIPQVVNRKQSSSLSSLSGCKSIPEDYSATKTNFQRMEGTTKHSLQNEVVLAKTWLDLLMQLQPVQQRPVITAINEVLRKSTTPILKPNDSMF